MFKQAAVPEYQVRFRWEPNSVAFWDNRATQHYAISDYFPNRRVAERISIAWGPALRMRLNEIIRRLTAFLLAACQGGFFMETIFNNHSRDSAAVGILI